MIQSFDDPGTKDIFQTKNSKAARKTLSVGLHAAAKRKLDQIDFADAVKNLKIPPGNKLEALSGDLSGFYSIRINIQWRIVFRWTDSGPSNVRICDYH